MATELDGPEVEDDGDVRATLGEALAGDPLTKAVVRSRVASKLFSVFEAVTLGRYQILERVGAGGIGVVWGAWDPDLERHVAIKLIQPTVAVARDRILAEGQALARLSHPNVVPIYDVGVIGEQVYLVMEWVKGMTLRAFVATPRTVREIVEVYRQAGEGLAAAHAAGTVHRDFKPDNAILGEDGRVRVLDFGLSAVPAAVVEGRGGTPRYRAPEQSSGRSPTFTVDQYAFAISLGEALRTRRDGQPRWLAAIIARAATPDPDARFPSMSALLRELARDPAKLWRRRLVLVGGAAIAIATFAIGRANTTVACTGSETTLAAAWSPVASARVVSHLGGLGSFGASEAARLAADLDDRARGWVATHHASCMAHERGELTTALYQQRLGCLSRTRAALSATVDVLANTSRDDLNNAVIAARSVPGAAACEADLITAIPPPPPAVALWVEAVAQEVVRAKVLGSALSADAVAAARQASLHARATGYAPLVAEALLVEGRTAAAIDPTRRSAIAPLEAALATGLEIGDDPLAVEAFARLAFAKGQQEGAAIDGVSVIDSLAHRGGEPMRFARALLHNNLGVVHLVRNERAQARARFMAALAEWRPGAGDDVELVAIPANLSLVVDKPGEGALLATRAADELGRMLGPNHARTLNVRLQSAMLMSDRRAARAVMDDTCRRVAAFQAHLATVLVGCEYELGLVNDELGDRDAAIAALRIAATDPLHAERKRAEIAAALIEILERSAGSAAGPAGRMQALGAELSGRESWSARVEGADAEIVAAVGWDRAGDRGRARAAWEAAAKIVAEVGLPVFHGRLERASAEAQRHAGLR